MKNNNDSYNYNIGLDIKELRIRHNLTQEKMAKLLSVTEQTVSGWENNTVSPTYDDIWVICVIFDVPFDQLLFGQNKNDDRKKLSPDLLNGLFAIVLAFIAIAIAWLLFLVRPIIG